MDGRPRLPSTRMPSRPGEFHPEPLTDPDLTLSRHPARATARRLPPSIEYRIPPVSFAPPLCRMPLGQSQDIPQADPGGMATPRFWHRLIRFRHVISGLLALASLNLA